MSYSNKNVKHTFQSRNDDPFPSFWKVNPKPTFVSVYKTIKKMNKIYWKINFLIIDYLKLINFLRHWFIYRASIHENECGFFFTLFIFIRVLFFRFKFHYLFRFDSFSFIRLPRRLFVACAFPTVTELKQNCEQWKLGF